MTSVGGAGRPACASARTREEAAGSLVVTPQHMSNVTNTLRLCCAIVLTYSQVLRIHSLPCLVAVVCPAWLCARLLFVRVRVPSRLRAVLRA